MTITKSFSDKKEKGKKKFLKHLAYIPFNGSNIHSRLGY